MFQNIFALTCTGLGRTVIPGLIAACLVILSQPVYSAPQVDKEDLKQLRSRIETLQKELAETEESKSEAADALRKSEQAIKTASSKLTSLAQERKETAKKLAQLQTQSGQIESRVKAQQLQLAKLFYRQYVDGGVQKEHLTFLLNQQDPNQAARNLHYYAYFSRARAEHVQALRNDLQHLAGLASETRDKNSTLVTIQARQAEQKKQLEQEQTEHRELLTRISLQADQQRQEISKLKQDEQRLAKLVEQIARMLARQERQERLERKRKDRTGVLNNDRLPDASSHGSPFQDLKGRLSLPVRGELANRFGSPRADGGVTWKGLFIRSSSGSEVKAIAAGRIVFADWLRGFGNLVIVDHGNSYMSLYGNNETIHKSVGDSVRGGDTIAIVGNSGGNPDSGLYFEIRHQGKPFDPLNWVRIK
ncbi:MAG TPA: peptidoglycan DD-metalloendopeptidase family protein [Nitrosospira sp.]|nr:peptidoglycan DD-metalloendopeptidase family protein [Nitrosospira sp.]